MNFTAHTRYIADDRSEFTTEAAAQQYLAQVARIKEIMAPLKARPERLNSDEYIQQDPEAFKKAWNELLDLAAELFGPHSWYEQSKDLQADASWAGRLIGEYDHTAFWRLGWFRMTCTDRQTAREYEQPFFASNPDKFVGHEIIAA